MGGGDLNLKKSWHPMLMSNQKRVWEEEQKALAERKKIDQMMKERAEERNLQELQDLQEAAGGNKRAQRVDWMYSGPSSGQVGTTEEMEGYLLGKRRIDGLLKGTENQKLEKSATEESFMALQNANTLRDTAAKIREDPMLAIKRQEQAAYEAMMNDPVRRRLLLKAAGQADSEHDDKRRKHRHRHRDSDDHGRDGRHRRSHSHRHGHHDGNVREHERSHRRKHSHSYSDEDKTFRRSTRRSLSPRNRRSRSPRDRNNQRERSRSPRRSRNADHGIRRPKSLHEKPSSAGRELRPESRSRSSSNSSSHSRPDSQQPSRLSRSSRQDLVSNGSNDVAARLSAMQEDAHSLDDQRQRRLQELAERDRIEQKRLEDERARNAKYGGRAHFVDKLHKQAGAISLGDRIGRTGQKHVRDED